jgi:tRNA modification GTPase
VSDQHYRDTIYALSTIFGKSGVAVFRISGSSAHEIYKIFNLKNNFHHKKAVFTQIFDNKILIDEVIIIYFKGPNSFTGEEVFEIHCHGSIAVIKYIKNKLNQVFRLAEPGEFTKRAFLNNKFDLTKAEGIVDLINAETEAQIKQTSRQLSGELRAEYDNLRNKIISVLANIEAYIDFPDEEIHDDVIVEISKSVQDILSLIETYLNDDNIGEKIRKGFHVTIVGKPNSGKSTLFNYLAKRELAIVTAIPGTTRDTLELKLDLDGYPVTVIDTAGIHETSDFIEQEGIKKAREAIKNSDIIILMVDINEIDSIDINEFSCNGNIIYVGSKVDNNSKIIIKNGREFLPISVHKNYGLDLLKKKISNIISSQNRESYIITHERHRTALNNAKIYLERFHLKTNIELAAENLRIAANYIGSITGVIKLDDILDKLFSTFCIGK